MKDTLVLLGAKERLSLGKDPEHRVKVTLAFRGKLLLDLLHSVEGFCTLVVKLISKLFMDVICHVKMRPEAGVQWPKRRLISAIQHGLAGLKSILGDDLLREKLGRSSLYEFDSNIFSLHCSFSRNSIASSTSPLFSLRADEI